MDLIQTQIILSALGCRFILINVSYYIELLKQLLRFGLVRWTNGYKKCFKPSPLFPLWQNVASQAQSLPPMSQAAPTNGMAYMGYQPYSMQVCILTQRIEHSPLAQAHDSDL